MITTQKWLDIFLRHLHKNTSLTIYDVTIYHRYMNKLQRIAQQQSEFALNHFVEVTNDLLPQFLPDQATGSRGQEPVNPRLVRHYTTQALLDKPLKQGREARYTYRHLLQLLAVRRLLAEGYSASSIGGLIAGKADAVLEDILQGGVQLTVEAANPALAFLSQIRDRGEFSPQARSVQAQPSGPVFQDSPESSVQSRPPTPLSCQDVPKSQNWMRLDLLDGLELHAREDFIPPATACERERLLQLIANRLTVLN